MKIIITCEHGGNIIPEQYTGYFVNATEDLNSHKGIDLGALHVFKRLAQKFADFSLASEVSRLLVELNRSLNSPSLFSVYSQQIPENIRKEILKNYYYPYRAQVTEKVKEFTDLNNIVLHISVHTFTPVLNKVVRKNDIGILFDNSRKSELKFCSAWKESIENLKPELVVMHNYPYTGTTDGLTKSLREIFQENYAGIELEINQKFFENNKMDDTVINVIIMSLKNLFNQEIIYNN